MDILRNVFHEEDWPEEAEKMYERIEVLGRGSFGLVWMAKRMSPAADSDDDPYVTLKNIEIKEEKGKVYAQREISILTELRHPHVIRLICAFPIYKETARLVALQLARGPNLQRVVSKQGAVGLPLARLISRQLVAAVSYLHGRAVLHSFAHSCFDDLSRFLLFHSLLSRVSLARGAGGRRSFHC
jgi:cyclin-dependent kinase 7